MKKLELKNLLDIIEKVISKNRDLLSVDDLNELLRCKGILNTMIDLDKEKRYSEYIKYSIEIILSLIKFFVEK